MDAMKLILLMASLSGLLLVVGYFIARGRGVLIAMVIALVMNFGGYWYKDILISTMTATIATSVVLLSRWAMFFGSGEEGNAISTIAVAIIAPIAATVIQMAISRSREYEADAGGANVSGKPEALASALAKLSKAATIRPMDVNPSTAHLFIVNPLSGGTIMNLFSTHPPLEKRIERLMKMRKEDKNEYR